MKLITQHPYPEACELACFAMICDVDLATVMEVAGCTGRAGFDYAQHQALFCHFGISLIDGCVTEGYGNKCLGAMMRKHSTLVCSLSSCVDPGFAHAIVIHGGQCYDPHAGMNPSYPWHWYIGRVTAYEVRSESAVRDQPAAPARPGDENHCTCGVPLPEIRTTDCTTCGGRLCSACCNAAADGEVK